MTTLLRRTMAGHLRSSQSRKIHNGIPANTPPVFWVLRPRICLPLFRLVTNGNVDRLLTRMIHDGSWRHRPRARSW